MIQVVCKNCQKTFLVYPSTYSEGGNYCSKRCKHIAQRGKKATKETREKISATLMGQTGEKNRGWKGGIIKQADGYLKKRCPNHPRADEHGYVLLHRLVLEEKLGRYLTPDEISHHIDFDQTNNDPDNLIAIKRGEHFQYHLNINRLFECWLGG